MADMADRGLIMSDQMIRAFLDGRKTQTRRLSFRGKPGDRLYFKEAFQRYHLARDNHGDAIRILSKDSSLIMYRATDPEAHRYTWRSARFTPKKAARCWAVLLALRTERLQEITEDDATDEAFASRKGFATYWDELHRTHAGCRWADNPVVWVLTFRRADG